ncbi:sensor histidine kinase [Rhodococcus sp. NPDC127528]|uniref:sensor histidine kinase n=1 Tax=unclassified Rhodococcus (in: high G+C Gram-positive bacteria) TaxID=192944 RepID=UPI00363A7DA5
MGLLVWWRSRYESRAPEGVRDYPWWLPTCMAGIMIVVAVIAVAQRGELIPPGPAAVAGLMTIVACVGQLITGKPWPPAVMTAATIGGVVWLLLDPVQQDFAPVLLIVMVGTVTATAGAWWGLAAGVASMGALITVAVTAELADVGIYVGGVLLGFEVGFALLWQNRALEAERSGQRAEWERATIAERQRIARDIHDVVGHSLSVTLLHLSGARHALESDRDVDEAIDALRDAERVGREAMADIRRTVGLLATEGTDSAALPGVEDIAALVESVRGAGLSVSYRTDGSPNVSPGTGLALYRITQESLANVAKHAPASAAAVRLEFTAAQARVTVENGLATRPRGHRRAGSGLTGMAERAAQLGGTVQAGPDPNAPRWVVDARLPASGATRVADCAWKVVTGDVNRTK